MKRLLTWWLIVIASGGSFAAAQESINFNRDIRPILAENCFFCHGQDANKRKAGLRLDIREEAIDSEVFVPGEPDESDLIERVFSDDHDSIMPPPDSNRKLTDNQKNLLRRWIKEGAQYEKHWAFVAPKRPAVPKVKNSTWVRNPIDHFVLAKLESRGMMPSPEADRATLIKRLSIDLIGIPPTPEQVRAFVEDQDPAAYEKLVDRLMANPQYGERLSLPWLDAARYADSNGFQQDGDTWQWIWRDWVVKAINDDLPFDKFTIWQLAGDLLPDATIEQKIASGFNRNHLLNGEGGAIAEEQRFVVMFDRMDTTSTTWLGLTMACAQCHDHKYDPITQQDYYSLMDGFNRVPESGTPQRQSMRIRVAAPFIELPTEANKKRIAELESGIKKAKSEMNSTIEKEFSNWQSRITNPTDEAGRKDLPKPLVSILEKPETARTEKENQTLAQELRKHFDQKVRPGILKKLASKRELDQLNRQLSEYRGDQIPRVMVMSDAKPRQTHLLSRGEYLKPKDKVSFATPRFLPDLPADAPRNRLGFARWLVSAEHPLTARVQVNRMWQYFLGNGIVKTAEDLGVQSEYPIHKDLLDWLAVEFRENGWSMKKLHRLILTSATYRQSSRVSEQHRKFDIENRLYSRAGRFRMPAMILRDWALSTSGLLETQIGGAPVYPYQPDNVWEALAITKERDFTYPASSGKDLYRRSLYTFWRRTVGPANMFDASNRQACRVRKSTTSTPLHALTTLNDPTWVEAARMLAARVIKTNDTLEKQLDEAFQRVICRVPTASEIQHLKRAFEKQLKIYSADVSAARKLLGVGASPTDAKLDPSRHAALSVVCLAILNLDEALTRE